MAFNAVISRVSAVLNYREHTLINDKLDDSFHFIFVLDHLRKHFMKRGVGLRQFIDIAVLIKNDTKINWKWTEDKLIEIGLFPFAKTVFFYINKWFGVTTPIAPAEVPEDVFDRSTDHVFNNGVFGFENKDNKDFLASNTVRQAKHPRFAMMVVAVKKMFPSYEELSTSEYYAFLKGKPYLLPAAWIYRVYRGVANNKISEGKEQISKSFVSTEYIAKREEMFKNWGID